MNEHEYVNNYKRKERATILATGCFMVCMGVIVNGMFVYGVVMLLRYLEWM